MIRTTVMLPEETHTRLRRIARRRGVPLARVIRDALTHAADADRQTLSFIGVMSGDALDASSTTQTFPPLSAPFSDATPDELATLRRRADEMAARRRSAC